MKRIGQNEADFIKRMIYENQRLDSADIKNQRKPLYEYNIYPQADISLAITQGETNIEIICKYSLGTEVCENRGFLAFDGPFSIFYEKLIVDLFSKYKIVIHIELKVIKDDGNVYGIFHEGLKSMLSDFYIPNHEDLNTGHVESLSLPSCKTFAMFEDMHINDPSKYEEMACKALVSVFTQDRKIYGFVAQKSTVDVISFEDFLNKVQKDC